MEIPYEQISDNNNQNNPYDELTHVNFDNKNLDYYIKEIKLLFEIDKMYECINLVKKVGKDRLKFNINNFTKIQL